MGHEELQELLWSFAGHRVLTVASRTGILGELDAGARTTDDVADRLALDPLAVGKMVRALCAMGVVRADGDVYRIDEGLAGMFRPGPEDFGHFLEHSHQMYDRWGESLEAWVRGERWETRRRDPDGVARFGAAMRAMAGRVAGRVAARLDLVGATAMLDVGGGTGAYSMAMCEANPGLAATVLDTPEVAALGASETAGTSMAGRVRFAGGDYMDPAAYGGPYGLVLIANVLHQERPDRASRMIALGAGALAPGGLLAIVDFSIDDEKRGSRIGTLFAINMRSFGDTHSAPDIRSWMEAAGLEGFSRADLDGTRWILSAVKPSRLF